jgi:flagellar assembly protein FliH
MATIIRTTDPGCAARGVPFNLDDLATQAQAYLVRVRAEGDAILAKAQAEADTVRAKAAEEGLAAALRDAESLIERQLVTVLPALQQVVAEIRDARQSWLSQWEASAVRVATAIAKRVIRRELERHPEIPLALVRESLELAAGGSQVCIRLNSDDHKALGGQVRRLAKEWTALGDVEVKADPDITPGGCRVETRFGLIDQQFESQLKRIEEELL